MAAGGAVPKLMSMLPDSSARVHPQGGRTLLSGRWALVLVALATAVIAGLLAMHGFSIGHHSPVVGSDQHASTSIDHAAESPLADAGGEHCPPLACDGPGAMAAMCMFMLLFLTFVMRGRRGSPWRWRPSWPRAGNEHPWLQPGTMSGVSLIRLCISRT